jgi:hypothetical protein
MDEGRWRDRARVALVNYFEKRSSPRQSLVLLILITGLVGFLASVTMLRVGITSMALRYPIAVLVAWCAMLGLIRMWVELEKRRFDPDAPELRGAFSDDETGGTDRRFSRDRGSNWLDWLDFPDVGSMLDEGCLPVFLVAAVIGIVVVVLVAIAGAPTLLAEVFLDVFISTVLYRRLKKAAQANWLGTAIRGTWGLALCTAALLGIVGLLLQAMVPEAQSIGPAIRGLFK